MPRRFLCLVLGLQDISSLGVSLFCHFLQIFAELGKVVSGSSDTDWYILGHNVDDFCANKVPFVTDCHISV